MLVSKLLSGAVSGFVATVPMTGWMKGAQQVLPRHQRFALPPTEITTVISYKNARKFLGIKEIKTATLASHLAYGAGAGAVYALLWPKKILPPPLNGALFGL